MTEEETRKDAETAPETPVAAEEAAASPEPAPAPEAPAQDADGQSLEAAAAEIAALNDRLMRVLAESENFRRRAQREREDAAKYAIAGFARDMLGVADNLRRAMDSLPEGVGAADDGLKSYLDGVALTERELLSILERHGITRIEPLGEKFDHNLHEAMFEVPTAEAEPGTVIQVMETGYMLHDRLLRAARVGIAKAPPAPEGEPQHVDTTV